MHSRVVLVVEDDPAILIDAVSIFEDVGLTVLSFDNADDALAHLYEQSDNVFAVFTDLQMPGHMDGLLLAEIVGRHWPGITVLLTSGRVRPVGHLPGNVRFLPKPWVAEQILHELQDVIQGEAARSA